MCVCGVMLVKYNQFVTHVKSICDKIAIYTVLLITIGCRLLIQWDCLQPPHDPVNIELPYALALQEILAVFVLF